MKLEYDFETHTARITFRFHERDFDRRAVWAKILALDPDVNSVLITVEGVHITQLSGRAA